MATLNAAVAPTHRTREGAPAKHLNAEQELRRSVLSCLLWEDEYYESGKTVAKRITDLCDKVRAETVMELAIEARTVQHLRHVPLLLADALAKSTDKGRRKLVATLLPQIIQRPDELTEFLAIYWRSKKQPLASAVKRGLASAFGKFNAYSLAKYNRDGKVKLKDVLRLCHAKPKDAEQSTMFKMLLTDTLPTPDTWEVALSSGADKKTTWERLIAEEKLGGLAMLRNLRNMQEVGVSESSIRFGINHLKGEKVLPFRFLAAATFAPRYEPEIEQAMFRNTSTLPKLSGKTALLIDHSGSMLSPLSAKSDLSRFDAACGLAILLREVCESVEVVAFSAPVPDHEKSQRRGQRIVNGGQLLGTWGMYVPSNEGREIGVDRPAVASVPARRGFALRDALDTATPWWGTNTEDGKQFCDALGYDRLIVLTDEQSHQALSAPKGKGYVINIASNERGIGYGKWVHIDGWSEGVVRYIQSLENIPA